MQMPFSLKISGQNSIRYVKKGTLYLEFWHLIEI